MANNNDAEMKKRRTLTVVLCSTLLVAMVVAVTVGVNEGEEDGTASGPKDQVSNTNRAIQAFCQPTDYRKTCEEQLKKEVGNQTADPKQLTKIAFTVAMKFLSEAANKSVLLEELEHDPRTFSALETCKKMMNFSILELQKSFDKIDDFDLSKIDKIAMDLQVWLSATITNEKTCLDGFQNTTTKAGDKMRQVLNLAIQMSRNGLAVIDEMALVFKQLELKGTNKRRLLDANDKDEETAVPLLGHGIMWYGGLDRRQRLLNTEDRIPILGHGEPWFNSLGRRLLKAKNAERKWLRPNIVVAQDGSGNFTTINQAIATIPKNGGKKRVVIYIKEGIYREKIIVDYHMMDMVWIGDGPQKTRIVSDLSFAKNITTFNTATVSVYADFFYARNIGFENSAGPLGFQAVALLVMSDYSVFYNCAIDGYQDTLYVHSKRQFYRDCTISGTIDYVFGNAAVVFQNCTFLSRVPLAGQQVAVTASGKFDPREIAGIVIQNSTFTAPSDYDKVKFPAYLGRPWGNFSTTVIMESYIGDVINPEGWAPWDKDWGKNTCFYVEFNNHGPGAETAGRVKWPGIKKLREKEVAGYTPENFVGANSWVRQVSRVPYVPGFVGKANLPLLKAL